MIALSCAITAVASPDLMPLPMGESAIAPGEFATLLWLAGAVLPALLLWAVLALVRAERTEATYAQRKARRALEKLVRGLRAAHRVPTPAELERWCALAAQLFAVPRAAPTLRDFQAGVNALTPAPDTIAWMALWSEARAALFSPQGAVRGDWVERAVRVCEKTPIMRVASRWPNRRHHWLPRAVVLVAFGALEFPGDMNAAPKIDPQLQAHFVEAREVWMQHLRTNPRDWAAQRNVAISYQAEDLWGPATAHWVAAFVQQPREASIGAGITAVVEKMDGVDPTLRRIVAGQWHERVFKVLSPGEWQRLAKVSAMVLALGFGVGVVGFYGRGKILPRLALGLVLVGVVGFGAGVAGVGRYGVLAQPNAACITRTSELRNVPSELVEQEKTTPLLAGQIVTIEGHYFGWSRIKVRSGAEGWVRRAAVLPLYEPQVERGATGYARPGAGG
ncbi:hypothetical protein [Oleiharenicola lentus]|uniref:hypothetical protein n=1 Tax=Oleiharenicola lentus TaxID=2508720 RepID=UPI003F67B6D7